jgi:hypothetical protein
MAMAKSVVNAWGSLTSPESKIKGAYDVLQAKQQAGAPKDAGGYMLRDISTAMGKQASDVFGQAGGGTQAGLMQLLGMMPQMAGKGLKKGKKGFPSVTP